MLRGSASLLLVPKEGAGLWLQTSRGAVARHLAQWDGCAHEEYLVVSGLK